MKTILVVDDDEQSVYQLQVLLGANSYRVVAAANGAEALATARREPPDVIVSDILMPVMDGFSLCREWKRDERLSSIPFVIYTATYTEGRDRELALGLGADRFLVKPLEPEDLLSTIRDILEEAERRAVDPERLTAGGPFPRAAPGPPGEAVLLKQYNEALVRKLERKMLQLEQANRRLKQDFAARETAELALRDSEERYRTLVAHSPDGILVVDREGRFLSVNESMCRGLGYGEAELLSMSLRDFLPEGQWQGFRTRLARILKGDHLDDSSEYAVRTKAGASVPVEVRSAPYRICGEVVGVQAIARDISERRRSEEALRNSEARFRELFRNMTSGVAVYEAKDDGADFVLRDINEAGLRISAVTREDAVGRAVTEVFPGIREMGLLEVFRRVSQTGVAERLPAARYRDARRSHWYENRVYRLPSGEIVAVYDNVTEQKHAEERLRESEAKYRLLHESMRDAFGSVDLAGRIMDCNSAYGALLGYTKDELQGLTYLALTPERWHEAEARIVAEQVLARGYSDVYEKEYRRKDGSVFPVELRTVLMRDGAGKPAGMFAIVRDITERKQALAALRESETRFRSLVDVAPEGIFVQREGRFVFLNPAMLRLFGASRAEDLLGTDVMARIAPAFRELARARIRRQMETSEPSPLIELEYLRLDGSSVLVETTAVAMRYQDRDARVVFIRDVSARKQAEAAIKEQLEELRRWHRATLGREGRVLELKKEVNELLSGAGQPPRYPSALGDA